MTGCARAPWGKREASDLVNEHWDLITRVADELLAKRALTGEEVEALVSTYEEVRQKFEEVRKKFGLTPKELEIVSAVVAGCSNEEIADYCKIGEDTVKVHQGNIFDKVGVSSRLELALFAVNQGLPLKSIEGPPAIPRHKPKA